MGRRGRKEEEKKVRNFNSGGLGSAESIVFLGAHILVGISFLNYNEAGKFMLRGKKNGGWKKRSEV